ncbi:uncharacterized protein METZ01_LOCUS176055, partial [marine metagenome]
MANFYLNVDGRRTYVTDVLDHQGRLSSGAAAGSVSR